MSDPTVESIAKAFRETRGGARYMLPLDLFCETLLNEVAILQKQLQDCHDLRDSWCAAYTELRDNPKQSAN